MPGLTRYWKIGGLLLFALACLACSASATATPSEPQGAPRGSLTIFAAASLSGVFPELGAAFAEAYPGASVEFNFAGSQQLSTQLLNGARGDIFASANEAQMEPVVTADLAAEPTVTFATNRLVVIAPAKSNPHDGGVTTLDDLARPGVKVVLALPEVPVGSYSRIAIARIAAASSMGSQYRDRVLANVVSEETNVRQVAQKVALGEADAGIVYATDAAAPSLANQLRQIPIPGGQNVVASYPLVILKDSSNLPLAELFVAFVQSDRGQQILSQYGFGPGE